MSISKFNLFVCLCVCSYCFGWMKLSTLLNNQLNQPCFLLHDYMFVVSSVAFRSLIRLKVNCSYEKVMNANNANAPCSFSVSRFVSLTHTRVHSNGLFVLFCLPLFSCSSCSLILLDTFSYPGKNLYVIYYFYSVPLTMSLKNSCNLEQPSFAFVHVAFL